MSLNVVWGIWAALCAWVLCSPVAYNWDIRIPGGHCLDRKETYISVGVIDIFIDVCIFLMPIPMVWNLQLPLKNRIGLLSIFGIGTM